MSRSANIAIALVLTLGLGACFGSSSGAGAAADPTDPGRLSQAAGGSSNEATAPSAVRLPDFAAPESMLLDQERLFRVRNPEGTLDTFRELLSADGSGEFRLELTGVQHAGSNSMLAPSLDWQALYDRRQRYLVRYRDLHRGEEDRLRRNYVWETVAGSTSLAGRSCTQYLATSRYGYGSVELYVDDQLGLLLGWAVRDEAGLLLSSVETTSLDLAPDHAGTVWSTPAAPEQPYRGPIDNATLGFGPLELRYAPAGYFSVEEKIVLTEQVYGTQIPNLHLEVMSDGLNVILAAQQGDTGLVSGNLINKILMQVTDLGGVWVVEGPIHSNRVYVVGSAPLEELEGVWTSAG